MKIYVALYIFLIFYILRRVYNSMTTLDKILLRHCTHYYFIVALDVSQKKCLFYKSVLMLTSYQEWETQSRLQKKKKIKKIETEIHF